MNIAVVLLSFGSGAAALIYEIVWFQVLELVIGSSAVSLAVLLAAFMGGTCLGSLFLPRLIAATHHPLRIYAALELGIAACGVAVLYLAPFVGSVAAICLLLPTILMGATLPMLARYVQHEWNHVSMVGFSYAANIAGAVFGCLLAGFYLLRVFDAAAATYVAAAINTAVAASALAFTLKGNEAIPGAAAQPDSNASTELGVYVVAAVSGFCALAAETIWTRKLGLLFGASVYTVAIIVAVFLIGLGTGSGIGSMLCRTLHRPRLALGVCQSLNAAAIAWTAYITAAALPFWPVNLSLSTDVWINFQLDLDRALFAVLPPTLLWGASFPIALAALSSQGQESGRLTGRLYAANTFGAILGALGAGLLLTGWIGSQRTEQLLIGLSAAAGVVMLAREGRRLIPAVGLVVLTSVVFMRSVPPVPDVLVAHGRFAPTWVDKGKIIYSAEGQNASVAVSEFSDGARTFHVAGKIQASTVPRDMRLQRMLGHLTTLTAANPQSVLVIGCGAGVTAGAVSIDPRVKRVTIAEIERLVPQAAAQFFSKQNFDVLRNPKVGVRIDDGRHFLLTSSERFDAITADPLDPWVKGAANLYTKEFFEAVKDRLNPGGVVTVYIQLFETTPEAVKSSLATFFDVFPNGVVFGNTYASRGHDMVLLGQAEPFRVDLDAIEHRLRQPDYARVADSLAEVEMHSASELFATYAVSGSDLQGWLSGAAINRDRNLRMQYLAGFGLNRDDAGDIYDDMLKHRR